MTSTHTSKGVGLKEQKVSKAVEKPNHDGSE